MDHHGGVDAALERFARALERSLEQRYPGFEFSVRRRTVACGRKTDRRVWFATAAGMTHALDCHVVTRDLRRPGRAARYERRTLGDVLESARFVRHCGACGGGWR